MALRTVNDGLVIVVLNRDTELVPGLTKGQLRNIASRTEATLHDLDYAASFPTFGPAQAEAGIEARDARKAAARA